VSDETKKQPTRLHGGLVALLTPILVLIFCIVGVKSVQDARADRAATATAGVVAANVRSTAGAIATRTAVADDQTTTVEEVMRGEGHVIEVVVFRDGGLWSTVSGTFCVDTQSGPIPALRCDGFSNGRFSLFVGTDWVGRASVSFTFDGEIRTFYTEYRGGLLGWEATSIQVV